MRMRANGRVNDTKQGFEATKVIAITGDANLALNRDPLRLQILKVLNSTIIHIHLILRGKGDC